MNWDKVAEGIAIYLLLGAFVTFVGYGTWHDLNHDIVCAEERTVVEIQGFVDSKGGSTRTVFTAEDGELYSSAGLHQEGSTACVRKHKVRN